MPQGAELVTSFFRHTAFQVHPAWSEFMIAEGAIKMLGLETRRFHRLLWGHSKFDDVEEYLQQRLVLVVATRGRERQKRLAIPQHDGWAERNARTFSRHYLVGMTGRQYKRLHARAEWDSGFSRDH